MGKFAYHIILVGFVFAACGNVTATPDAGGTDSTVTPDAAVTMHTVTLSPAGNGSGTITSTPAGIDCGTDCSAEFTEGAVVTLHAVADPGATFVGWSSGGCSGTEDCTVTVTADLAVQASFALNNSVVVTLDGNGVGTVTSSPMGVNCPGDCSEAYGPGEMVTLTATAGTESVFAGWSGGACTGTAACTVTTDAAVGVTATFTRKQYVLSVSKGGNGAGTVTSNPAGISCGATCDSSYDSGAAVTLVAAESAGSTFAGWSGGGCSGTGTCTVTLTAATTVTATFTLNQYPLTVMKAGNGAGAVTSNPSGINCGAACSANYNYGQTVTLTASPAAGSLFSGWSGGGCSGTGTCVVTINAATTVTATFTLSQHILTVAKAGTGTGTVLSNPAGVNCGADCSEPYNYGASVSLTPNAASGSVFAGWSGACTGTGACTVSMTAAQNVTATFNKILSCNSSGHEGCLNGSIPEVHISNATATTCHDQCQIRMAAAGMTSGCWVLTTFNDCYCRSGGVNNSGTVFTGGTCSTP